MIKPNDIYSKLLIEEVKFERYTRFMEESNSIEGEKGLNPNDLKAVTFAVEEGITTITDILKLHKMLTKHLKVNWSGKFRTCDVVVGDYVAPKYIHVPELMAQYIKQLPNLDSWEAHNRFETIHPFQDFNGRMGRLIWLSKAVHEGYRFGITFLHKYYYQTLDKQQRN